MAERGNFRASDAERDQIVQRLHKATIEGRIAAHELEQRVSTALKARTYRELEATVADLPGQRQRRRSPARRSAPGYALATLRANPMLVLFALPVLAVAAAMLLAATIVWSVLILVVFILGGRRSRRPPWLYGGRHEWAPARRGPGRHWA